MKKVTSILLALMLVVSLAVTASAADTAIHYGGQGIFSFQTDSVYETDLFDNFKAVMPGDKLSQNITVSNGAKCSYVKVYLYAEPHTGTAGHEIANNNVEFLKQLTLTVKQGDSVLSQGPANRAAGLENKQYLGKLYRGQSLKLEAILELPIETGNEFRFTQGEVDWIFVFEEYNDAGPKTGDENQMGLYVAMLGVSLAGMLVILALKKKKA